MKPTLLVVPALALLSSLAIGCGGQTVTCPADSVDTTVPGQDFVSIPYAENGHVCLTQKPISGFPFLGRYKYDDFGTPSAPDVYLDGPENSTFAPHGVTDRKIHWGVAVNEKGQLVGQTGVGGASVYLFFKYMGEGYPACTPGLICDPEDTTKIETDMGKWKAAQLSLLFDLKEMRVFGERILKCADSGMNTNNPGPCATEQAQVANKISFERN